MSQTIVTLSEIENNDSRPASAGRDEYRYLCCLSESCRSKPRDAAHRSLCVNKRTGAFFCHRCDSRGRLKEFWEEREKKPFNQKQRARFALQSRFTVVPPAVAKDTQPPEKIEQMRERMRVWQTEFLNSPAEIYLSERGIPPATASEFGCGYASAWEHWEQRAGKWHLAGTDERVVFPITGKVGELVAVQARAINAKFIGAEKLTKGDKSLGVFQPADVFAQKPVAIVEGPVDALALAACGVATAAIMGTSFPVWLPVKLGFCSVLLATDADASGDAAAFKLDNELNQRGARTFRLRPRAGKDWAEVLENIGVEKLSEHLAPFRNEADDEVRLDTAWLWHRQGREAAAQFAAGLIENLEYREWILEKMNCKKAA